MRAGLSREPSLIRRPVNQPEQRREPVLPRLTEQRWLAMGASLLLAGCGDLAAAKPEKPEHTEVMQQYDFGNSFPVDEAELSLESEQHIIQEIHSFLDQHNSPEGFTKLGDVRVVIEVSSDERPTKQWGEKGNEALSEARLMVLDKLVRRVLKEYSYADGIPKESISHLQSKTFIRRLPGGAWGVGVTPLTRLENPATHEYYTDAELKKVRGSALTKLYDQARYAKVKFELPGQDEVEKQYDILVGVMAGYDHVTMLADRSGSMVDDYARLGKSFSAAYERANADFTGDTTYVVPFEIQADLTHYQSVPADQVPDYLTKLRLAGSHEQVFHSLNDVVTQQMTTPDLQEQRKAIVVLTDEGIQDFSVAEMRALGEKTAASHTDVYYALIAENGLITMMDQPGLQYEYDTFAQQKTDLFPDRVRDVQLDRDGNVQFSYGQPSGW
ncbi:MAG: hypothetical protein HY565_01270 [Candidatus Kerfeldbacteria bacterium]|nr:hypothetical protein [Candidatus Kerfeldbacteria bacterium]